MKAGDVLRVQRTFTVSEVEAFAELTRDRASWHLQPDARGRLVVHGLLTAALATQIGGELGFMARDFNCTFLRPVYTGETVTLTMTCTELSESSSSGMGSHVAAATRLGGTCVVTSQAGTVVARIATKGVIPRPLAEVRGETLQALQARL